LRILEEKIKAKSDKNYFNVHSILSLNFGEKKIPDDKKLNLDIIEQRALQNQLFHQLNERITFVKPQDPIVAQLLFDLGNITAIAEGVESAIKDFELAEVYGFQSSILDKRKKYFNSLIWKAKWKNYADDNAETLVTIFFAILFIALIVAIFITWKWWVKKQYLKSK
jgi:hypothetical protein